MPTEIVGDKMEDSQLFDAVNILLSLQVIKDEPALSFLVLSFKFTEMLYPILSKQETGIQLVPSPMQCRAKMAA